MKRIAVTGGIAEGKSTVLGYCRLAGLETASSDDIAREVYRSEGVQQSLADLLDIEPPVPRETLRERLAEDPHMRRAVNAIMHPSILRALLAHPASVLEVPLLIETCIQGQFDRVWVVTCGEDEQLRRLAERLGDEAAARTMLSTQLTTRAKYAFADFLIRTNHDEPSVMRSVIEAVEREF